MNESRRSGEVTIVRYSPVAKLLAVFCLLALPATSALTQDAEERPEICRNATLLNAVRIIDEACSPRGCDASIFEGLDTEIDRATFLAALRNPLLSTVHVFFQTDRYELDDIFDWNERKNSQIKSALYFNDPENTVLFIVGKASAPGSEEYNFSLSRRRAESVHQFVLQEMDVRSREVMVGFLGEQAAQLNEEEANMLGVPRAAYRGSEQILNQSVHVFAYPCADLILGESRGD